MIFMCTFNSVYCLVLVFIGDGSGTVTAGAGVAWLLLLQEYIEEEK